MAASTMQVWVSTNVNIDLDLFDSWLRGQPAEVAARKRQAWGSYDTDLVVADTNDQYGVFQILLPYLQSPKSMMTQSVVKLPSAMRRELVNKFYEIHDPVARAIGGKVLSRGLRKDLDEVSEDYGIHLVSCRRQFDNLKRIFKTVEDVPGKLVHNIQKDFLLDDSLAQKYARLVFITNNRLSMEKKPVLHLRLADFLFCADLFMTRWTSYSQSTGIGDDQDLDRLFLQELREMKYVVNGDVQQQIRVLLLAKFPPQTHVKLELTLKSVIQSLIHIGAGLSHSKELRDIFEDVVEKVVHPLSRDGWQENDIRILAQALPTAFAKGVRLPAGVIARFEPTFERYMSCMAIVMQRLFHV